MSAFRSVLRVAASRLGLALALGFALAPAHPQESGAGAGGWVKLCDRGQLKDNDGRSPRTARAVEVCMTLTEQIHPDTGKLMVGVTLQQVKLEGVDKNVLTVTVAPGVVMEKGALITAVPPDLWQKAQQRVKLDAADETRLRARSVKLPFKQCVQTGCVAETELTPLHIDLLKGNGGLVVLTVRQPGNRPIAQPVPLNGFAQALEGPPTDSKRFKDAREQMLKEIDARRKTQAVPPSIPEEPRLGSATGSGAPSWVRVCDRGTLKGKMKDGSLIEKAVEMCMATAEPLHPETGKLIIIASLTRVRLDGREKQIFGVSVPRALKTATDATVAVLPADLWAKVKKKEKLDSSDERRLEASTVQLAVKLCLPVGCNAETEATPELIGMLKGGAGLRVRTVSASGKRDTKLVPLDGFEQALSGPSTNPKAHKRAREQMVKDIVARQAARKKREERAKKRKEEEG